MKILNNEEGFVLVTGLLMLVVLTMLGISATTNTTIELQISANDRQRKETFYDAESVANIGTEVLEQNFNCATGFGIDGKSSATASYEPANANYADLRGQTRVYEQGGNNIALWRNPAPKEWDSQNNSVIENRDIYDPAQADSVYPVANIAGGVNVGDLYIGGFSEMLPGGALQMAAGYEGKGKGSASGGVAKIIDIYSVYRGELNSQDCVSLGWRHVIGSEGDCIYD